MSGLKTKDTVPAEAELKAFQTFLSKLESAELPSRSEVRLKRQRPNLSNMQDENDRQRAQLTYQRAQHGPNIGLVAEQQQADFEHDLTFIQRSLEAMMQDYCEHGSWTVAVYAKRARVLLRRAKRKDLSDRFNKAWEAFAH